MVSSVREPCLVSLQAPSRLSALQTRTRPGDVPLSISLSTLSWAPRPLQLREGLFGGHPAPSLLFRLSDLSTVWAEGHVRCKLRSPGITRKTLTLLLSGVKPGL